MDTPKKIGLVGLGAMGRPMARHLMKAGFEVSGCDSSADAQARAAEAGVRIWASAAEVAAESDCVIIVVGFDHQVESVIFGEGGLIHAARHGLIVGIGSTISPTYARQVAQRLGSSGVVLLDMALTRGEPAAEAGTMLVMGGGDEEAFEACRPLLRTFASDVFNLGPFGSGQIGKMVNNLILWACMSANDESLRLGEALGVEPERLRAALVRSSAQNWSLSNRADERPTPWAEKDMAIALREADRLRFSMPLCGLVKEVTKEFKVRRGYATPSME